MSFPTSAAFRRSVVKSHLALSLAGLILTAAVSAQEGFSSITLDFNDLAPSPIGTHMPSTYEGLVWGTSDWHYLTLAPAPDDAFLALSGTATTFHKGAGEDFYFDGADFWSRRGLDANGRFYYILHHDGVMVYDGREDPEGREVFTAVHQTFVPTYTGLVDSVAVVFDQGGDDWDHLAMDNVQLRVVQAAPEPATTALLGLSAISVGFIRRRRDVVRR